MKQFGRMARHQRRAMSYYTQPVMKLQQLDAQLSQDGALQLRIPFEASSLSVKLNLAS